MVPAQFRVIVTRRPKYACRACQGEVVQAPAPERLIENGLPTEALVAQVLVAKYADHLPLYRQAQIWARQGIEHRPLDPGRLGRPRRLRADAGARAPARASCAASTKLFADETTVPVLDPGRGRTKTGQLWAYARDDRPWGGSDPPAVAYVYAPGPQGYARPGQHLAGFAGILQVDGYGAYRELASARRGRAGLLLGARPAASSTSCRPAAPRADRQRGARRASPASMPSRPTSAARPPSSAAPCASGAARRSSRRSSPGSSDQLTPGLGQEPRLADGDPLRAVALGKG